ncbi:MAG: arginine decarboxylase, pyruvoyl-dependent [Candidatus Tectomicrobia bacterium]|nr:arginine decarboxylase, pyruvoyl-dependent [Candidatus Tectomicrobia bacterium]
MIVPTPTQYFMTVGCAEGGTALNAFDAALMAACIGNTNILKMSSILPPHCQEVPPFRLPPGALVPAAYATMSSDQPGLIISAAVGIAFPEDEDYPGLIMETQGAGTLAQIEEQVARMAAEGMEKRGKAIRRIVTRGVEHRVERHGAVLAAVVLWN